jgi:hypothetical protein
VIHSSTPAAEAASGEEDDGEEIGPRGDHSGFPSM